MSRMTELTDESAFALLKTIKLMKHQQLPGGTVQLRVPVTFPSGVSDHLSVTHPSNWLSLIDQTNI